MLLTNYGCELDVWNYYSSLNMSQYRKSMDLILCQISKLLPGTDFLILTDKDVRRQEGFDDCGLFVLAYMLTLCSGQDPSCVTYKQKEMRGNFNT